MKSRLNILLIIACMIQFAEVMGQPKSFWGSGQFEFFRKKIDMPIVAYDYELLCSYPDSTKTELNGKLYKKNETVLDENKEFTSFKNEHCYYKADHKNKIILYVDLDKIKSQIKNKPSIPTNSMAENYMLPDSMILQYGTVQIQTVRNKVKIVIDYSPELTMRKSIIDFDKDKQMVSEFEVVVDVLYESNPETGNDTYAQTKVRGFNFSTKIDEQKIKEDYLFVHKNGKIVLKKFQNYKLTLLN